MRAQQERQAYELITRGHPVLAQLRTLHRFFGVSDWDGYYSPGCHDFDEMLVKWLYETRPDAE